MLQEDKIKTIVIRPCPGKKHPCIVSLSRVFYLGQTGCPVFSELSDSAPHIFVPGILGFKFLFYFFFGGGDLTGISRGTERVEETMRPVISCFRSGKSACIFYILITSLELCVSPNNYTFRYERKSSWRFLFKIQNQNEPHNNRADLTDVF